MSVERKKPLPERLPSPSFAPPLVAIGLMLALWGVVTTWIVSAVGILMGAIGCALWIRDLSRDARDILAHADRKNNFDVH